MVLRPTAAYVLDTSVAIKWYLEKEEADVARAHELLNHFGRGECIIRAPQLLLFEIANALTTARKLPVPAATEALAHLRRLGIDLRPLEWATFANAIEIASTCDVTIYDSYFLALALTSGSILVTADDAFLRKTRGYPGVIHLRQFQLPDQAL